MIYMRWRIRSINHCTAGSSSDTVAPTLFSTPSRIPSKLLFTLHVTSSSENMTRLDYYDEILQHALTRFRALLKPPTGTFTGQLPANVESNPTVIAVVLVLFNDYLGIKAREDTPLTRGFSRLLAIGFISAMKIERPDVIHSIATGDYK
ncbi:hypothetical protein BGZ76_010847 [Entomortierella beljakovae]|nr:hypothetical protein BGZ76_010847 [Entomortierella beljakovae]